VISINQKRRNQLKIARGNLSIAEGIIETVRDEEEDTLSNWPESLEGTDRYQESEASCDCLDEAFDAIETAIEAIDKIINKDF